MLTRRDLWEAAHPDGRAPTGQPLTQQGLHITAQLVQVGWQRLRLPAPAPTTAGACTVSPALLLSFFRWLSPSPHPLLQLMAVSGLS